MSVADAISGAAPVLSPAERRVAEVVLDDPQAVAFGTVAAVAARAGTSGATVVRLANRLGFDGYVALQAAVQDDLADRLRPASQRIRQRHRREPLDRALAAEVANVQLTLEAADPGRVGRAVSLLAGRRATVYVVSGDASSGCAATFASQLAMLRPGVALVTGGEVRAATVLAHARPDDVLVAIDVRRYDRWLLAAVGHATAAGVGVIALTDSALSPLASMATESFVVEAVGSGPFDSQVGVLALLNVLTAGVADRLQASATARLDRVESAWTSLGALTDA